MVDRKVSLIRGKALNSLSVTDTKGKGASRREKDLLAGCKVITQKVFLYHLQ